jgi:hypothetical protein
MDYKELIEGIITTYLNERDGVDPLIKHDVENELRGKFLNEVNDYYCHPHWLVDEDVHIIDVLVVGKEVGDNYVNEIKVVLDEEYKASTINWKETE